MRFGTNEPAETFAVSMIYLSTECTEHFGTFDAFEMGIVDLTDSFCLLKVVHDDALWVGAFKTLHFIT